MNLSNQALGAIMLALQKSIAEQSDIVPVLQGLVFEEVNGELIVNNPPVFNLEEIFSKQEDDDEQFEFFKD